MDLPGYRVLQRRARPEQIKQVAAAIQLAKRPVIYAGGGVIAADASEELRELVHKTGIPITHDRDGTGGLSRRAIRCSWACSACTARSTRITPWPNADLLIALGVRFDDRVTGKFEEFAKHAKIIHVDIDASEINKNKEAHLPIVADVKQVLARAEQDRRAAGRHLRTGSQQCDALEEVRSAEVRCQLSTESCSSTPSINCRS